LLAPDEIDDSSGPEVSFLENRSIISVIFGFDLGFEKRRRRTEVVRTIRSRLSAHLDVDQVLLGLGRKD
jgi:hypothetical protein